jgi:hypothetical protein
LERCSLERVREGLRSTQLRGFDLPLLLSDLGITAASPPMITNSIPFLHDAVLRNVLTSESVKGSFT